MEVPKRYADKIPILSIRPSRSSAIIFIVYGISGASERPVPRLSTEVLETLKQLPWKGNVRELRNAIERVVLLNNVSELTPGHFAFLRDANGRPTRPLMQGPDEKPFVLEIPSQGIPMSDVVKDLILKTLSLVGGNQVQAAKVLGLTRSKLRYRMEQLGIHPEQRSYKTTL